MKNLTRKQILELGDMLAQLWADDDINSGATFSLLAWALKYSTIDKKKFKIYVNNRTNYYYNKWHL